MIEFDNKKLNASVGAILVIVLLIFTIIYYNLKSSENTKMNTYKVSVSNIAGIKKYQSVDIGGYNVGYVKNIDLNRYSPILTLSINRNIEITSDAKINISNISLLSSAKFVSIINGIDEEILLDNSYITDSNLGVDLDQLLNMITIYLKQKLNNGN